MDAAQDIVDFFADRNAEEELRDTISSAVWHAAYRTIGALEIIACDRGCCADERQEFTEERFKAERADPALQLRLHLEALRLAVGQGLDPTGWAINARKRGATWQQIGDVLGTSRQAAQERFSRFL